MSPLARFRRCFAASIDAADVPAKIGVMVVKRVYPDTPVALHYPAFPDIDWCKLVDADEVILVITPVLLREINDKKDSGRGQIQQRARRVSGWIGDLRRTKKWSIRPHVGVEVNAKEPEPELFTTHGLEPSVADDRIVACILRDAKNDPSVPLVCVTSDNTLAFKAEAAGITVVDPPEPRLPDEPDAAELENRKLRQEILDLRKRVDPAPNLTVQFPDGTNHLAIKLAGTELPSDEYLDEEIAAQRSGLELGHKFLSITHRAPSPKAVDAYLKDLRKWMTEYRDVAVMRAHTFDLHLVLSNSGMGNAHDIEIDLTFTTEVFVAEKRTFPTVRDRPSPPEAQETFLNVAAVLKPIAFPSSRFAALEAMRFSKHEPVRLSFDENEAHLARVHVDGVKHHALIVVPKFHSWFLAGKVARGFQIAYRIHAASTPEIVEGVLDVKVHVADGPARLLRDTVEVPDDAELPEVVDVPDDEADGDG